MSSLLAPTTEIEAGKLPSTWAQAKLGDVVTLEYGKGLTKAERDESGGVPVFGSSGVTGHHNVSLNGKPCLVVGRKGAAGSVHLSAVPCWTIDTAYYVEPPAGIELKYLYYLLSTLRLSSLDKSTAVPSLSRDDAYAVQFYIAPTNEQKRIVAKIEELFTKLEAGVDALKRTQVLLKRYRQAVLKAAVEGELSRAWREANPDVESAEKLLEVARNRQLDRFDASDGTRQNLPSNWAEAPLEALLRAPMINGLSIKGSENPPGVAALKLSAMSTSGFDYDDVRYLPISEERAQRLYIEEGDFFVSRGNGTLSLMGRGTLAQPPLKPTIFPDTMIRIRLALPLLSTNWVPLVWQSQLVRRQIERRAKTTAGIWKVSQADLRGILLPMPPVEEQSFIVKEVERQFSILDSLDTNIQAELKRSEQLRQAILKKAFSGQLVSQNPDDEPASVLLERIKAEKQESTSSRVKSGKRTKQEKLFS